MKEQPSEELLASIFFSEQEKVRQQVVNDINPVVETSNTLKPTWELMHSDDLSVVIPRAKELGWRENKVQVKRYMFGKGRYHYYIEPYEEGCNCPNLLSYEDYV